MGTVLPPWKLELIEKRKKRLELEKAKEQERIDRYSSIPEWKRTILSKRKSFQTTHDEVFHNSTDNIAKTSGDGDQCSTQNSQKISRQNSSEENSLEQINNTLSNEVSREIIHNGGGQEHSLITTAQVSYSGKQKPQTLSSDDHYSSQSSQNDEERVLYEHIKTPSEIKRLYELQVAKRKALEEEAQNISSQALTRRKSLNESQNRIETIPSQPNVKRPDTNHNGFQSEDELVKQIEKIDICEEQTLESAPPARNDFNGGQEITKQLQNGDNTAKEIHVVEIRNKFGPSGSFRRRSSSSDNLLKSSPDFAVAGTRQKPAPFNKRWSMISLMKESDDNDNAQSKELSRARSLSDVRNETPQPDPPPVYLRHRASVSHDIEHRIHELLHHSPAIEDDPCEDVKPDVSMVTENQPQSPVLRNSGATMREKKALWFNEQPPKPSEAMPIAHLPQDKKSQHGEATSINLNSEDKGHHFPNHNPVNTGFSSSKSDEFNEKVITALNAESNESFNPCIDICQSEKDDDTKGPSVHKLSALFGSSIIKGKKTNKTVESKTEPKNAQNNTKISPKIFPWMKKSDKNNQNNSSNEQKKYSFNGVPNLKPVQNTHNQQMAGNVALVIGGSAKTNQGYKKPDIKVQTLSNINGSHKPADCEVTVIDVPETSPDIQVSAIDIPEAHSPTPVSVIDMPDTKDVSIIDEPQESDSDSDSDVAGSYDVNSGVFTFVTDSSESRDSDEEEDIDNVPVSYYGDSSYMRVPDVVFETEPGDVKSILSGPIRKRKRKNKVAFHPEKLERIHDYPSEVCMQTHYDNMSKEQESLGNYKPSSLQNINLSLDSLKPAVQTDINSNEKVDNSVKVTYSDAGEGFSTSSSGMGALLF